MKTEEEIEKHYDRVIKESSDLNMGKMPKNWYGGYIAALQWVLNDEE